MKEIGKRTKYYLIQSIVIFVLIVIHIILGATFYHKTKQHKYFPLRHGKLFIYTNNSRYKIKGLADVKNVSKRIEEEIALNKKNNE